MILTLQVKRLVHVLVLTLSFALVLFLFLIEVSVVSPNLVEGVGVRVIISTRSTNIFDLFQGLNIWEFSHHMSYFLILLTNKG